jgi:hypothetical protein
MSMPAELLSIISAVDPNVLVACATVIIATLVYGEWSNI